MSGLEDAVDAAFEKGQNSIDPDDWRVYHALNAALSAERAKGHEQASTEGIPSATEAGYVSEIHIEPPDD